jgi:SHS2 domain-containing protein
VPWRHVPHTADVAIEAEAPTLEALCVEAAEALTALLVADPRAVPEAAAEPVQVAAAPPEELLLGWLRAVHLAFELDRHVGRRFGVKIEGGALEGVIGGAPFDPARHGAAAEVKGVTYHGLVVERTPGGWRARVLVDL